MSGWSLYLDEEGRATYLYNCFGHDLTTVQHERPLPPGRREIEMRYDHDGGFGAGGVATLFVDGEPVDEARVERTVPIIFSISGETFDVGVDTGAPVGPYEHGFECTAEIHGVTLERLVDPDRATGDRMREGERTAALRAQ
jgi:arylsulfatase